MDKPVSISVKAWLIRQMSVRTMMQESMIETIVNHQFDSAYVAIDQGNSLEFSGFGRFIFNKPKAFKKLEKMKSQMREYNRIINDENTIEARRMSVEYKLKLITKTFEYLNNKLNECSSPVRGMEKQPLSSKEIKEDNSESEPSENDNLQEM